MTLAAGTRLGHYEVQSSLGVGGMGEVYRARDTTLNRDVALKVLPESFANDPDRLARFQREAHVLASLNHPHIGGIYGVENSDGVMALVLELVEGPTLADRIALGAIPLAEALPIAKQIAEALDVAHEQGIIHRDLKPANIKVRPDGTVKVLDFGLAKAMDPGRAAASVSQSATITSPAMTAAGIILGTAAYMSPEQARGFAVNKRTDLWAFGCVLFEMLTARAAFARDTITDTLAAIVEREPDWTALPADARATVQRLLKRCLEKDPKRRLRDMGDVRIELEDPAPVSLVPLEDKRSSRTRRIAALVLVGSVVVGAAAIGSYLWRTSSSEAQRQTALVARFTMTIGESNNPERPTMAWFPDGSGFVYLDRNDTLNRLYVRALDQLQGYPLPGTEGAANPFLAPDGEWIGFFSGRKLKKVPIRGGTSVDVSSFPPSGNSTSTPLGASWSTTGSIVFGFGTPTFSRLWHVSASGGTPRLLGPSQNGDGSGAEAWPEALPDGKSVLFTILPAGQKPAFVAVASLATGERKTLLAGSSAQYVSKTEHLVYMSGTSLMGVRFDLARLEVVGAPVELLDDIQQRGSFAQFSVASTGSLVYMSRAGGAPLRRLMLVDRRGQAEQIAPPARAYSNPRVSPDGQRIVVAIQDTSGTDAWVYDMPRAAWSQLTFNGKSNAPIWTPDGKRVTFAVATDGKLHWKAADGTGTDELLSSEPGNPHSWSPDSKWLARVTPVAGGDAPVLRLLDMDGGRKMQPFLSREGTNLNAPAFSPDGRWLAYVLDRRQIFVRGFPAGEGQWLVSSEGVGTQPMWARSGRELFYRDGDKMMAVDVVTTPVFKAATPRLLFEGQYEGPAVRSNYDVTPDGHFVMVKGDEQQSRSTQLNVVLNWTEELKRRVPGSR